MGARRVPKIQQLPSGAYRIQVKNKHESVSQVFKTLGEAEAFRAAHWGDTPGTSKDKLTFGGFVETVFKKTAPQLLDPKSNTAQTYSARLRPLVAFFGGMRLAEIDTSAVKDYRAHRERSILPKTGKPPSADTIRTELAVLSSVLSDALDRRLISSNPAHGAKRPAAGKRRRRVPAAERLALGRAAVNPQLPGAIRQAARFFFIQGELGCRVSELAGLLSVDLSIEEATMRARDTKNNTDQLFPVSMLALQHLRAQRAVFHSQKYVFQSLTREGEPRPYNHRYALVQLKELGVVPPDFHTHALRREYISASIERGVPYDDIRAATGQKTIQSLQHYNEAIGLAPARLERIHTFHEARRADLQEAAMIQRLERAERAPIDDDPERARLKEELRRIQRQLEALDLADDPLAAEDYPPRPE